MPNASITWRSFAPDLRINIIQEDLVIPLAERDKAEQIWQTATQNDQNMLFNGQLFSVQDVTQKSITVRPTEFKYFHAQVNDPDATMSNALWVHPLACSGVVTCEDGIIFAQRSTQVTLDRGLWELAPSGTFDNSCVVDGTYLSPTVLIQTEMREELGIPNNRIIAQTLKGGITNHETGALDLVIGIELDAGRSDIENYFSNRLCDEYMRVRVVPKCAINQFVEELDQDFSRSSQVTLKTLSLI
jgi:hypothetical protein